jgi:hypothetical protein
LSRWVYLAAVLFLGLTVLATLGFGEHYAIDLVVGVPYALLLGAACAPPSVARTGERRRALAIGAGLTIAWMSALRLAPFAFHSVAFTWLAAILTVALCGFAQHQLERALHENVEPRANRDELLLTLDF